MKRSTSRASSAAGACARRRDRAVSTRRASAARRHREDRARAPAEPAATDARGGTSVGAPAAATEGGGELISLAGEPNGTQRADHREREQGEQDAQGRGAPYPIRRAGEHVDRIAPSEPERVARGADADHTDRLTGTKGVGHITGAERVGHIDDAIHLAAFTAA